MDRSTKSWKTRLFRRTAALLASAVRTLSGAAQRIHSRFDAAQSTPDNRRNWEHADGLAPNAAVSPEVRAKLRDRARYEEANNPYLFAQVRSLANDVVGPNGPTLQVKTEDARLNRRLERAWREWARAVDLPSKLRLVRRTQAIQGECFVLLTRNENLPTPVKLDLLVIEPDLVTTPLFDARAEIPAVDGIEFDSAGNPTFYHVLNRHPGETGTFSADPFGYRRVPAADVLHFFRAERPGQRRGYPEIASSLGLYSDRRRYRTATLDAADTHARASAVFETQAPDEPRGNDEFNILDLPRHAAMVLPGGMTFKQLSPGQPTTTFGEFDRGLITEGARPLQQPRNVATGDSSDYNYASTRADHQTYDRACEISQQELDAQGLFKTLARFCAEAGLIDGLLPASARRLLPTMLTLSRAFPYAWNWRQRGHVDEVKNATAQKIRLESRTTTLADEYAQQGEDWEVQVEQIRAEQERLAEVGLLNSTPLLGPALTASLDILSKLRDGAIEAQAAVELLTAAGVPKAQATRMIAVRPTRHADREDSADDVRFKREIVLQMVKDGTLADVLFNLTDARKLLAELNVPIAPDAPEEPLLPIVTKDGRMLDSEGNPLVNAAVKTDPARNGKAATNGSAVPHA